jgi:hypothetical protein
VSSKLDKEWVDSRLLLLLHHLDGNAPRKLDLFEPTPDFYVALESGEDAGLAVAASLLCKHIGLQTCPAVSYEWGLKLPIGAAGLFANHCDAAHIDIPIFYVGRPAALGAILAHEITHAYLFLLPFPEAWGEECEPLTDLASIYIGLGKAVLNGIHVITSQEAGEGHALGYLGAPLTAYSYMKVIKAQHVKLITARRNLNDDAISLLNNLESF